MVLALTGLAVTILAAAGSLYLPLKRPPRPDLLTIGDAVLPLLVMAKLGAGEYDTGQILLQGGLWGVVSAAVSHTVRVRFTPRVVARSRAKREARARQTP
ncbi:hypothetical protein ACIGW1_36795 [Streptomyces sp. NPDC053780]|uniref:hypothetical protein n=1 Tax=unclassified Streptomyces TaxID=2593676 RepID=UPI0034159EAF